ncbi:MAG: 3-hydroxyacyl-CoA dehydrogenase family protein [Planctomycetota bacterium]
MQLEQIQTIGIAGVGQMGTACAVAFRRAGYRVLLWGRNAEKLAAVPKEIEKMESWCDDHTDAPVATGGSVETISELGVMDTGADVILDCIIEVMEDKVDLLGRFSCAKSRDCLFLSATSALSITEMASKSGLSRHLVGAHFWNPPHLIPLVEMVQGEDTPQAFVDLACELMKQIGKVPVVCRDVPGFVGNRLLHAMWREALHMVEEGVCSAEDVDKITRLTFALRLPLLGPIENMDYVGLDQTQRLQSYMAPRLANQENASEVLQRKIDAGHLGVKSGRGFYDWEKRDIDEVIRRRDAQVVQQLKFLREIGEL